MIVAVRRKIRVGIDGRAEVETTTLPARPVS
jgi:hypothetical protein